MSGDIVAGRHGEGLSEEEPGEYAAFKIEQRGIDLIPDAERKMRPSGLFWLWSGAVFNVEFFYYGTLIMIFGLSVPQAVIAIVIGNLFYALLGWALGIVVGAGVYLALAAHGVRRERAEPVADAGT